MKTILQALLLVLLANGALYAQNGSIRGTVIDQASNAPLVGASIQLQNTTRGTITDLFGNFEVSNLAADTYEIRISYLGYREATMRVLVQNNETTIVKMLLEPKNFELSEITVVSNEGNPLSTIGGIDINLRPIQSSQEILRIVPGLFIAQHAGGGKAEQIFLRGFDIDHGTDVSLAVDGMPVNKVSHAHGQGYADLHFIIPETVERVDFGKGPYKADQGNFATAGYANFNTRRSLPSSQLKLEAGRFDTYRAVGMFNLLGAAAREKQQNAYLATEYMFTNGYFESPQQFNRFNLMGRYEGKLSEKAQLHASVAGFRSRWDASGQIPQRAVEAGLISRFGAIDNTEGGITSRYSANMTLSNKLPNGATLRNQVYAINYNFELYSNFTFFLEDPENGDQIRQRENRNILGYHGTYSQELSLLGRPLRSNAGIGFRYDAVQGSELSRTLNRRTTLAQVQFGNINELNAFAYISETWQLSQRWSVNAALRFDQFMFRYRDRLNEPTLEGENTTSNIFSPKLNLYYTHSPKLQLYASTGRGFHSNDTRVSVSGEKEILPAAHGTDLGVVYKPVPRLMISSALWLLDLEQELIYVGDEGVVEPSGPSRRFGVDFSARYQLTDKLFADADLNLARPRFRDEETGENFVPLAPLITSTGGLSYLSKKGFRGSLRYRYLGHRPANEDYSLTADGYFLLDATLGYTINKYLEFTLTGENLLNQEWKEAQFETSSRLRGEPAPVSEIHFTPGTPFFIKAGITLSF